jgi:hypothetical protein
MRLLRLLTALILAAAAIIISMPALQNDFRPGLYEQGGLRPLLTAERYLNSNNCQEALKQFQVVALRGNRSSQDGLFQQVRLRFASAGAGLVKRNLSIAWLFLTRYVLWSKDFNHASGPIENTLLEQAGGPTEFKYPLMDESGLQTSWGIRPVKAPLGLYRRYIPRRELGRLPGGLYNHTASEIPGQYSEAFVISLLVLSPTSMPQTFLEIEQSSPTMTPWYLSVHNRIQWASLFNSGQNSRIKVATLPEYPWNLDRLVMLGEASPFPIQAYLVHRYKPLSKFP